MYNITVPNRSLSAERFFLNSIFIKEIDHNKKITRSTAGVFASVVLRVIFPLPLSNDQSKPFHIRQKERDLKIKSLSN